MDQLDEKSHVNAFGHSILSCAHCSKILSVHPEYHNLLIHMTILVRADHEPTSLMQIRRHLRRTCRCSRLSLEHPIGNGDCGACLYSFGRDWRSTFNILDNDSCLKFLHQKYASFNPPQPFITLWSDGCVTHDIKPDMEFSESKCFEFQILGGFRVVHLDHGACFRVAHYQPGIPFVCLFEKEPDEDAIHVPNPDFRFEINRDPKTIHYYFEPEDVKLVKSRMMNEAKRYCDKLLGLDYMFQVDAGSLTEWQGYDIMRFICEIVNCTVVPKVSLSLDIRKFTVTLTHYEGRHCLCRK